MPSKAPRALWGKKGLCGLVSVVHFMRARSQENETRDLDGLVTQRRQIIPDGGLERPPPQLQSPQRYRREPVMVRHDHP